MMNFGTVVVAVVFASLTSAVPHPKIKALWNLERMGECRLGYNPIVYNGYGCWCGVGGSGTPADGIDT